VQLHAGSGQSAGSDDGAGDDGRGDATAGVASGAGTGGSASTGGTELFDTAAGLTAGRPHPTTMIAAQASISVTARRRRRWEFVMAGRYLTGQTIGGERPTPLSGRLIDSNR
jgi:hypothetical protein